MKNENAKTVEVVINAGSGVDDKSEIVSRLKEIFAANEIEARFSLARSGAQLPELANRAAHGESQTIVAAGGDGTIGTIAAALIGTDKTLGVLPLGTLNHFSKDLGIPQNLEDAVRVIAENYTAAVDVGEVNGQIFINNSSIGLYPSIVRRREHQQRLGRGKWYAAFWAAIAVVRRYPFFAVRLNFDGETILRRTPFVFVGNNEYEMDTFKIGGRKSLDAGKLSVYLVHRTGRIGLIRLILRSIFGLLRTTKDFDELFTSEVTIETRRRKMLRVALDGDVVMLVTPFCYRSKPGVLRVIVPPNEAEIDQQ